jgi:hypothetical protein
MAEKTTARVNPIKAQKYLKGIKYPAAKQDLVKTAKSLGADELLMSFLQKLPDTPFNGPTDVTKALGQLNKA